ncbi:MAG TPA: hypothetical protein V6D06_15565 [Trichocoleus sp.]
MAKMTLPENPTDEQLRAIAAAIIQSQFQRGTVTDVPEMDIDDDGDITGIFVDEAGIRFTFTIEDGKTLSFQPENPGDLPEESAEEFSEAGELLFCAADPDDV